MHSYPAPATALVAAMIAAANNSPDDAIAFQGAPGANSHLATLAIAPNCLPFPCFSFEDAFEAVESGKVGRAVIPIENSIAGRVADVHVLLPSGQLHIVGEHFLRVRHCLLAHPGVEQSAIRQVISHPQALAQCRERLRGWGMEPIPYADTAGAAALVAEGDDPTIAAIAPALAAEVYGLNILADGIEDVDHNTTRFVVLSRTPLATTASHGSFITSFSFEVRNIPAALYKAMGGFATNGVNMTKLESYQRGGSFTASEFFADIQGTPSDPAVARALDELRFHTKWVRLLGTYPQAQARLNP